MFKVRVLFLVYVCRLLLLPIPMRLQRMLPVLIITLLLYIGFSKERLNQIQIYFSRRRILTGLRRFFLFVMINLACAAFIFCRRDALPMFK